MGETLTLRVPDMTCDHCRQAIVKEVGAVAGVTSVEVDLDTKLVTVHGDRPDIGAVREAIDEAGYEAS
jgi:copper chaperone